MAFSNPLHTPIDGMQYSGFSALSGATKCTPGAPIDNRRRLVQRPYFPSGKWQNATSNKKPSVYAPITFDYKGHKGSGIPMSDLSARGVGLIAAMMEGGDDRVLAGTGNSRISFRILWPGYDGSEWARSIDITVDGGLKRAQLAQIVAQNFVRYMEKYRKTPCTVPDTRIALNNIRFEHLVLVAIYNTFEDSWQADVVIDLR